MLKPGFMDVLNHSAQAACTCVKLMVKMAWDRLLVSFMLVEAVVLFSLPFCMSDSMSPKSITICLERSWREREKGNKDYR